MASIPVQGRRPARPPAPAPAVPELHPGDHLDQKTFHERYLATPPDFRAELIGGIVFMPSPVSRLHGDHHGKVVLWVQFYQSHTPGVEAPLEATAILDDQAEPEPDACLLIAAPGKGQTRDQDGYIGGAPELMAEVSFSS